ncbi:E3 ubiquitin-protein ligase TRIM38-like isoform X2 [Sorex fumeus]|uniref:E3 ubiquitin-protein ligase TRIM38-like isoform X2 n=1 Tax=Sorex fumeus TaxID=62283 RepID=UPI0024AE2F5D|nr:E3 ubiquitin-protein ligase TRIM38-like isoform X2 [Sorex fumeus]
MMVSSSAGVVSGQNSTKGKPPSLLQMPVKATGFPGKNMASGRAKKMKEEATCPICLDLMTEPVIIDCGHIYCHSCILENVEKQQQKSPSLGIFECPVCRAQFQRESIRPSKQLGNLIDTIKMMEHELLCEEHGEKLFLFCKDDGQLLCWCCERSAHHKGHTTVLAEEACQGYKETFGEILTNLREQEVKNKEWQQKIREKITKVKMILYMEEKSYLRRLENRKEEFLKNLQDSEAKLEKQSQELNKHILELERKCQGSAQQLLQDVTDTLERISALKLNAQEGISLDIYPGTKYRSHFHTFIKMFEIAYVKVTLDPDTAHNNLLVNKKKNKVTSGSPQVKHETPARFKDLPCVLGCETITSGKKFFVLYDVEGPEWDVGVCRENVSRDNDMKRDPESGFWAIRHTKGGSFVALTHPLTPLSLVDVFNIGVFVDYEDGFVSFYDVPTKSHIFTFPKASFSEPIRPYFSIGKDSTLCT